MESLKKNIYSHFDEIVKKTLDIQFNKDKDLKKQLSPQDLEYSIQDAKYNIEFLLTSLDLGFPEYFINYIQWLQSILITRSLPDSMLKDHLQVLKEVLVSIVNENPIKEKEKIIEKIKMTLEQSMAKLQNPLNLEISYIDIETELGILANKYIQLLLKREKSEAIKYITSLVDNLSIKKIFLIIQMVQYEVGWLWQINKVSVAMEHFITAINQYVIALLYDKIFAPNSITEKRNIKIIASCAPDENHELGIRMISELLEIEGYDTFFFGSNTPQKDLLQSISEIKPDIVAISVTLITHLEKAKTLINNIQNLKINKLKVIIGGYPFAMNPELYKSFNVDGTASSFQECINLIYKLIG